MYSSVWNFPLKNYPSKEEVKVNFTRFSQKLSHTQDVLHLACCLASAVMFSYEKLNEMGIRTQTLQHDLFLNVIPVRVG